ncbi:MAG TPA: hypothetical protein VKU41_28895, partial [Polyangiaceae bacterium]|nr:hypothetical protein [Polyangiaceae bacterium]
RRRLTATVGVGGYDLLSPRPGDVKSAELLFRARVRYDADYGASGATNDPTQINSVVPGFDPQAVDLMYAYLEGRRFLGGFLGFKVGRQYVTDSLGWWSFDGGEASMTTPFFLKAEVYGGTEQRGGMPLSTARFQPDGIWIGNRPTGTNYDSLALYPAFQPAAVAPAFGVALESTGVTWIHGRLTYRRVYNSGDSNLTEFASGLYAPAKYSGLRVSSERLGYAVDASWASVAGAKAGIVYDFYQNDVTSIYGSIDGYLGKNVTLSADYDYYVPWFDADSIFSFFQAEPMNDVGLRANVDVDRHLSFAGSGHVRVYGVQTASNQSAGQAFPSPNSPSSIGYYPTNGQPMDGGGTLSARWRTGETLVNLHGAGSFGDEGDRVGADVAAEHVFETRYLVGGRAGVWQWDDKLRPDRDATSFNYVANVGYRFAPRCQGGVEWEHDINRLVGQRFRLMFTLALAVTR